MEAKDKKKKPVEMEYIKMEHREQILLRPDSYVGSTQFVESVHMYVFDEVMQRMVVRTISYVPGLYKIFDEILVNAADNKQRDNTMDTLRVDVDVKTGTISVYNNGRGIPVEMHKKEKVYVPELIFGQLLTGSSFDDEEKRTVGGRNGYGAKLANIYSTHFIVETQDQNAGLKYKQEWRNNMAETGKPIVTPCDKADWTRITFTPDLPRFGKMTKLDDDIVALFKKRVYDMAGTFEKGLKVYWNGEQIKIAGFKKYCDLFLPNPADKVYAKVNDRWQVCVGLSEGQPQQVSFVNRIWTFNGGTHVNCVVDQIVKKVTEVVKKKKMTVRPLHVKNQLFVMVNCLIENPAFDAQTKAALTTKKSAFGSECVLDEKMLKDVMKSGLVDRVMAAAKISGLDQLKKTDAKKKKGRIAHPKLDDANFAGTKKASQCVLILTEGDSAKTLAVSGLSVIGRDYFGVFPLKGKVLNVRDASPNRSWATPRLLLSSRSWD